MLNNPWRSVPILKGWQERIFAWWRDFNVFLFFSKLPSRWAISVLKTGIAGKFIQPKGAKAR